MGLVSIVTLWEFLKYPKFITQGIYLYKLYDFASGGALALSSSPEVSTTYICEHNNQGDTRGHIHSEFTKYLEAFQGGRYKPSEKEIQYKYLKSQEIQYKYRKAQENV